MTKPFDRVLKWIREELEHPTPDQEVVRVLLDIGREALQRAASSKKTQNISGNQLEAYGCAVYYFGERQGTRFLEGDQWRDFHERDDGSTAQGTYKDPKRGKWGRGQALHAARDHKTDFPGYELFLFNAMYYSAAHEAWGLTIITQELIETAHQIAMTFGVEVNIDELVIHSWY